MTRPTNTAPQVPQHANLTVAEMKRAIPKLERRIKELKEFDIRTIEGDPGTKREALKDRINNTLSNIFGFDTIEFNKYEVKQLFIHPHVDFARQSLITLYFQEEYAGGIKPTIAKLETIISIFKEKIADSDDTQNDTAPPGIPSNADNSKVFLVHGHDEKVRESVARFLSLLDLDPIILHKRPNQGKTIIEKFEANADVGFAVVLLTPDDMGYPKGKVDEAKPRARQNVIFELGFFVGKLGRERVCIVLSGDVERPSDYDGIVYIKFDENGDWNGKLAQELKTAGLPIDMNKIK